MIPFSTWLYSSQTKLFSLETALFWLPLFHTESLPVTSFSAGACSIGLPLHQASFQMVLEFPTEEPSSESLGNSYIVFTTQAT